MKICFILEGCYPYVRGGVSTWTDQFIRAMPEHEFILWTIDAQSERRGRFLYDLPPNVVEVREIFLDEALIINGDKRGKVAFSHAETQAVLTMVQCENPDWATLFNLYNTKATNPVAFLQSEAFLTLIKRMCEEKHAHTAFSDLFFSVRSMVLPLLFLMAQPIPQADIYHAVATGYSGVLGTMGAWKYASPFIVSEHGIYTREREEEILRSKWMLPSFRTMWIAFFNMLSRCAYDAAQVVTSLYEHAKKMQIDLGCMPDKCTVINNGINYERYADVPPKKADQWIDIGAIVRIAHIKDIKTMIYSFAELKHAVPQARLHVLGGVDDEDYDAECRSLVTQLGIEDLFFVGNTDVKEYLEKLDFTILTSISEGQPLAIIESMAARRAVVSTDVGSCRELLEGGPGDDLGHCGICVPPMHPQAVADAMRRLCLNKDLAQSMGEIGRERARKYFTHERMLSQYRAVYKELMNTWRE